MFYGRVRGAQDEHRGGGTQQEGLTRCPREMIISEAVIYDTVESEPISEQSIGGKRTPNIRRQSSSPPGSPRPREHYYGATGYRASRSCWAARDFFWPNTTRRDFEYYGSFIENKNFE